MKPNFRIAIISLLVLLTLPSCSVQFSVDELPDNGKVPKNQDYALVLNSVPQSNMIANGSSKGSVFFLTEDGTIEPFHINGIDRSAIKWVDDQIFFSDQHSEYIVDNTGTSVSNRLDIAGYPSDYSEGFQNNIFVLSNDKVVSFYNTGFSVDDYVSNVVVRDGMNFEFYPVFGYFEVSASCGDSVIGITRDFELNREELQEIFPKPQVLGQRVDPYVNETSIFDHNAICHENKLIFRQSRIMDVRDSEENLLSRQIYGEIVIWDIESGEKLVVPMKDSNHNRIILGDLDTQAEVFSIQKGDGRLSDNWLLWVSKTSENIDVMQTEIQTGITKSLFSVNSNNTHGSVITEFSDGILYLLDIPNFPNPGQLRYITIDLLDGNIISEIDLSEINSLIGEMEYIRDFARNPNVESGL